MGQDKALLPFQGEPLVKRVVGQETVTEHILVITNRPDDYRFLLVPLATDVINCKGPLVGLYTALYSLTSRFVILVGCDMPFINPSLLSFQLHILEQEDCDVVIPRHDDILEPLHAVYRRETCLDPVRVALDEGYGSLIGWHYRVGTVNLGSTY
jgi:molybdopterin-guanine dinucleotide biosynthesis protein A